jgi:hypothetical protein
VPEVSHVRLGVPEQGTLNRILREGGAQAFPQWMYAEPHAEPQILWWGIRGAPVQMLDVPEEGERVGLFPRPVDDWTEAPRGLVLATRNLQRATDDLAPALSASWTDAGEDELLEARCRRMTLGRSKLLLAEPMGDGYTAACLERFGEGPIAVALDGTTSSGRPAVRNPITGGSATYVRIGPRTAPTLIFLPAR